MTARFEQLTPNSDTDLSSERWWHLRLPGLSSNAQHLLVGKSLRAFADGLVSVVLPVYLLRLGYSAFAIGAIVTSTLLGSAGLTCRWFRLRTGCPVGGFSSVHAC